MPEPATIVLGGITVAVISGAVGKLIGGNNKVSNNQCDERREAYLTLVTEKIDNLIATVNDLKDDIAKVKCKTV